MARKKEHFDIIPAEEFTKQKQKTEIVDCEDRTNAKIAAFGKKLMFLPKVDLYDSQNLQDRILWYFDLCEEYDMKPLISGLAMALGFSRSILYKYSSAPNDYWKTLPQESRNALRQAFDYLELNWENNFVNGKINPVSGIFMAKNNFGYQDKVEYQISPTETIDTDSIISKYDAIDIDTDD